MMGAMTLTSCAWQAIETRSACCIKVISRLPTTTASVTSYTSSISGPGSRMSRFVSPEKSAWYHTFHSSKLTMINLSECLVAATWSAVATTALMKRCMFSAQARKESMSPSIGS